MSMHDPIADLFTRIRNASLARHRYTEVRFSKMKESILSILKQEGFIESYAVLTEGLPVIRVYLRYNAKREPLIQTIQRVSSPGRRIYVGHEKIPKVLGGLGIAILSTSKGMRSSKIARREGLGGELIGKVW